jgi:hypothetical protein
MQFLKLARERLRALQISDEMLKRGVNVGFSGGEKKRNEVLQMALLQPKLAILDETDSGLDIDALKIVSDGVNYMQGMMATQLNHHIESGQVQSLSVIKLTEFVCNVVQNRKIIIVLNCDVVRSSMPMIIGQPLRLDDNGQPVPGSLPPGLMLPPQQEQPPPPPQQQPPPPQQQWQLEESRRKATARAVAEEAAAAAKAAAEKEASGKAALAALRVALETSSGDDQSSLEARLVAIKSAISAHAAEAEGSPLLKEARALRDMLAERVRREAKMSKSKKKHEEREMQREMQRQREEADKAERAEMMASIDAARLQKQAAAEREAAEVAAAQRKEEAHMKEESRRKATERAVAEKAASSSRASSPTGRSRPSGSWRSAT